MCANSPEHTASLGVSVRTCGAVSGSGSGCARASVMAWASACALAPESESARASGRARGTWSGSGSGRGGPQGSGCESGPPCCRAPASEHKGGGKEGHARCQRTNQHVHTQVVCASGQCSRTCHPPLLLPPYAHAWCTLLSAGLGHAGRPHTHGVHC